MKCHEMLLGPELVPRGSGLTLRVRGRLWLMASHWLGCRAMSPLFGELKATDADLHGGATQLGREPGGELG